MGALPFLQNIVNMFSFDVKDNRIFPCLRNIRTASVLVNLVVFLVKSNDNAYQKGEHSCKCTELFLKRKE